MSIDPQSFARAYDGLAAYRDALDQDLGGWARDYWHAQRGRYQLLLEYIGAHVRPAPGASILDVGIFPGYFTLSLAEMGFAMHAVDLDPSRMLDIAAERGMTIAPCDIDSDPLPFPDRQFDVVFFNAVIEHLRLNPLRVMREFRRVLKPGGKLLVQTPSLGYWMCRAKVLLGRGFDESPTSAYRRLEELGHPGHIRVYQMFELEEMVRYTGFDVIHTGYGHFERRPPWNLRGTLDRVFGVVPALRRQLLVTARRPVDDTAT